MSFYAIKHITRYTYAEPVIDSANQVLLFPVNDDFQEVKKHELLITQTPSIEVFTDYFGNQVGIFSLIKPHKELLIRSLIEVETKEVPVPADELLAATQWSMLDEAQFQFPMMDFLIGEKFEALDAVTKEAMSFKTAGSTPFAVAKTLSDFIYTTFTYRKGITSVETGIDEIWKLKAGVCQDFAHILLVMLRIAGIPARYVSGYICPKNHELRGEGATHAWVEAYLPEYGWIGLDPTNNCLVSDRHVRLAIGRDFSDCTPVKGTYKGSSEHSLEVSVIINNGTEIADDAAEQPVFTYQVNNPARVDNSYRKFMEMQQQQ